MIPYFNAGGPLAMTLISIAGLAILLFTGLSIRNIISKKRGTGNYIKHIPIAGATAFMTGILMQTIGMYQALSAIQAAVNISPAIIAGGFQVSLIAPIYGLILFVISLVTYLALDNWRASGAGS